MQLAPDESSKSACVAVALVSCMELPDESSASIRDAMSPFILIDEPDDVSSSTFPLDLKPPGMEIDAPDVASSSAGLLIFTTPFTMIDAPDETSRSLIVGDDTVTVIVVDRIEFLPERLVYPQFQSAFVNADVKVVEIVAWCCYFGC